MMGMEMLLLIITLLYWSWLGFFFLSRETKEYQGSLLPIEVFKSFEIFLLLLLNCFNVLILKINLKNI
jgi:hypothetical protein